MSVLVVEIPLGGQQGESGIFKYRRFDMRFTPHFFDEDLPTLGSGSMIEVFYLDFYKNDLGEETELLKKLREYKSYIIQDQEEIVGVQPEWKPVTEFHALFCRGQGQTIPVGQGIFDTIEEILQFVLPPNVPSRILLRKDINGDIVW